MNKITCCFILAVSILLVGCSDDTSDKKPVSNTTNAPSINAEGKSSTGTSTSVLNNYENDYGEFEVFYSRDKLDLKETYEDFGLNVSSVEYGAFLVSDAYDYYPDLENNEGKIGYVKIHIAMELPATLDPALFFYPSQTVLTIAPDIPPISTDNNFADEVAVNLGEVATDEGYLFYLLAPNEVKKLDEVKSFTLSTFAPFTSRNMEMKEGFSFKVSLD